METGEVLLSPPDVGVREAIAAACAVSSGWVAPIGPSVERFESLVAKTADRKFAVALSSGTSALHLGLLALGVKKGDHVICSSLTFVATANAISYIGAVAVFVDSDRITGNMSSSLLSDTIQDLTRLGKKIGAVIPVDFLGAVADYDSILSICDRYDIPVLSDAAESLGSVSHGRPSGSFGEAAVFSFNGNKIITTSGGGAFLTNERDVAGFVRHLATQARENRRHYEHERLGYNYRMSNVLASVGIAQLKRLDTFVQARRANRARYRRLFEDVCGVEVLGQSDSEDNCWLTAVAVIPEEAGFRAEDLATHLREQRIESRPLWKPMHMQPLYRSNMAYLNGSSEWLFENGLALPSGSSLTRKQWNQIETALHDGVTKLVAGARGTN